MSLVTTYKWARPKVWNTGPAAERARHNLKLNKNKKIKRTPGPKLQAASPRTATIKKDNKT
jgi:hypothetical protein